MGTLLSLDCPPWTDDLLAKRRRAAYDGTAGPGGSPMGRRTQPRNEKFFTLFSKACSNVVESAADASQPRLSRPCGASQSAACGSTSIRQDPPLKNVGAARPKAEMTPKSVVSRNAGVW